MTRKSKRVTVQKYGGDDRASWAVLVDGRPAVTGLMRSETAYYRKHIELLLSEREGGS